jgi:hypothetical protein
MNLWFMTLVTTDSPATDSYSVEPVGLRSPAPVEHLAQHNEAGAVQSTLALARCPRLR